MRGKKRIKRWGDEISKHMMSRNGMEYDGWEWYEPDRLRWDGKGEKTRNRSRGGRVKMSQGKPSQKRSEEVRTKKEIQTGEIGGSKQGCERGIGEEELERDES